MGSGSDSSMNSILSDNYIILLLVAIAFLLGRIWMDVFILTVNCRDWVKKKRLSTTDRILTLQGGIRLCLGGTMMIWFILAKFSPWYSQTLYSQKAFRFSSWYFIACNFWLTASLCSYYCVKIADFSHPFFIHLKLRLSGLESTWLLGSAVLALASSLPLVHCDLEIQGSRNFSNFLQKKNVTDGGHSMMALDTHILLGFGYFAASSICATSAALLLFSLWRHHQRMQGSWGSHKSPQTEAHFQAVVTILLLLIISVIVFICIQLLLSWQSEGSFISRFVALVVLYSCLSVESLISIWGNKKLKNELRRSSHFAKCKGCVS